MTLDDANKIDEQAYDEMHREHISEQTKLDAYFKGYEKGIDRTMGTWQVGLTKYPFSLSSSLSSLITL